LLNGLITRLISPPKSNIRYHDIFSTRIIMSIAPLLQRSCGPSHWDSNTECLDQTYSNVGGESGFLQNGNVHGVVPLFERPEQATHVDMNEDYEISSRTPRSTTQNSSEISSNIPITEKQTPEFLRPYKKSKGRPRLEPDDPQSAAKVSCF
jgi:hypothetical protein